MKNLILLFSFVLIGAFSANAQSCSKAAAGKACCASKKTASATSASASSEADLAAEVDGNITKRTCEISGTASYYKKAVCEKSGNVSWEEVQYDSTSKKFTKVAAASMEKDAVSGEVKAETKACCKGDKSKSCSAKSSKKACAAEKAEQ